MMSATNPDPAKALALDYLDFMAGLTPLDRRAIIDRLAELYCKDCGGEMDEKEDCARLDEPDHGTEMLRTLLDLPCVECGHSSVHQRHPGECAYYTDCPACGKESVQYVSDGSEMRDDLVLPLGDAWQGRTQEAVDCDEEEEVADVPLDVPAVRNDALNFTDQKPGESDEDYMNRRLEDL